MHTSVEFDLNTVINELWSRPALGGRRIYTIVVYTFSSGARGVAHSRLMDYGTGQFRF
jgi:hypothetical protein